MSPKKVARDIYDAALLDHIGLNVSLLVFRALRLFSVFGIFCVTSVISTKLCNLAKVYFQAYAVDICTIILFVINIYCVVLHIFRETLTVRRIRLLDHPQREFYRSVDISIAHVVRAECDQAVSLVGAASLGLSCGAISRFIIDGAQLNRIISLAIFPVMLVVSMYAITFTVASRNRIHKPTVIGHVFIGLILGVTAAVLLNVVLFRDQFMNRLPIATFDINSVIQIQLLISIIVSASALVLCRIAYKKILKSNNSYTARGASYRATTVRRKFTSISATIVSSDLQDPVKNMSICRILLFTWFFGSVACVFAYLQPELRFIAVQKLNTCIAVLALVLGLCIADIYSTWIGPLVYSHRWRCSWEAGANIYAMAVIPLGIALSAGVLIALPLMVGVSRMGGSWFLLLSVVLTAIVCDWIATSLFPGEQTNAGPNNVQIPLSAGFLAVFGSACLTGIAWMLAESSFSWILIIIASVLIGVAIWTAKRRILRLPLRPSA
ncbi:hypothetical protein D2E26_1267 [Bifidobacterium dolichotidis]|uniref:Uncharacterized protein n=1 Tax=Bifidobacterium dolichotidis TaxID=2306976 RepID=A0A430FQU7_9BIFI|nr:hypothetical protein [Bifidobacterium dolichotidis]RSX55213.1 hypothetical protein D2E26_1267 [Bifidobacterium dolichotidis]